MPIQGLPGGAEVWQVDGEWFAVYTAPELDVPMMFAFERDELREAAGVEEADKVLTSRQAEARGAVRFGVTSELDAQLGQHPWDSFLARIERDVDIAPWLADPEVLSHVASAWLRGSSPDLSRTEWWQSRTDQERRWLEQASANPTEARQQLEDMRRQVADTLRASGVSNPTSDIVSTIADNITRGHWTQDYGAEQLRRLADPFAPGEMDREVRQALARMGASQDRQLIEAGDRNGLARRIRELLANRLGDDNVGLHLDGTRENPNSRVQRHVDQVLGAGSTQQALAEMESIRRSVDGIAEAHGGRPGGFTQTREHEDTVRDTVRTWLGPKYGDWSQDEIARWAGKVRNDPNAKVELEEHLRGLRMAAFPNWTNEDTTYEQIASVARTLFQEAWGQTPDEHDPLFTKVASNPDHDEALQLLRREGWERGIGPVVQDATRGALRATGGQVRRAV